MQEIQALEMLRNRLHGLCLFRGLLQDSMLHRFVCLLDRAHQEPQAHKLDLYCDFVSELYLRGGDFGAALLELVLQHENPALRRLFLGHPLPGSMAASLENELQTFSMLSSVRPDQLAEGISGAAELAGFESTAYDFQAEYHQRLQQSGTKGYGMFAVWHMFSLGQHGRLLPVKNPDPQRLDGLTGYQQERGQLVLNTKALLQGFPANNILLYGDAGTGKSSTVKALANEYRDQGLRLVEVRKHQLEFIPELMGQLADHPLKFILFIDDLSFPADDRDFTELKAILEGNVSARPRNLVVYATSNRRHMVQQLHGDRVGDQLHLNDTLQEQASLAARFGLTVTFIKPDRELYLEIVNSLAAEYGLEMATSLLETKAEAHAIRYGGRSPRVARQFVEYCLAEQKLN